MVKRRSSQNTISWGITTAFMRYRWPWHINGLYHHFHPLKPEALPSRFSIVRSVCQIQPINGDESPVWKYFVETAYQATSIKNHLYQSQMSDVQNEFRWYRYTHNLVSIHDGLQTMGHGEKSDILGQMLSQWCLDNSIRFVIYCRQSARSINKSAVKTCLSPKLLKILVSDWERKSRWIKTNLHPVWEACSVVQWPVQERESVADRQISYYHH